VLEEEPLDVLQVRLDVNRPLRAADFGELALAPGLGEIEDGHGAEGPVPEDGGRVICREDFNGKPADPAVTVPRILEIPEFQAMPNRRCSSKQQRDVGTYSRSSGKTLNFGKEFRSKIFSCFERTEKATAIFLAYVFEVIVFRPQVEDVG
jgi:hypothetical protein